MGSWQFAYSQNEAKREQRPCNSLIRYSQNEAKREQRPGNLLILYIILNYILTIFFAHNVPLKQYILNKIKKRPRAWTPRRFCEVASHGKDFSFFFYFLKKISINCRFFTQKEPLPTKKKKRSFTQKK